MVTLKEERKEFHEYSSIVVYLVYMSIQGDIRPKGENRSATYIEFDCIIGTKNYKRSSNSEFYKILPWCRSID